MGVYSTSVPLELQAEHLLRLTAAANEPHGKLSPDLRPIPSPSPNTSPNHNPQPEPKPIPLP